MAEPQDAALFRHPEPTTFVPTAAAVSAWDERIVHGAAVTALFAGRLTPTDRTLSRLTVEFLAPVPMSTLTFERTDPSGGTRVQRQDAVLSCDGRAVARATSVLVRRAELDLPSEALDHGSPFDPSAVPALDQPHSSAEDIVGRASFDSRSMVMDWLRVPGDARPHQWISLAVPVVEGAPVKGTEVAAVASDYGQTAVHWQLPFATWSFRNAEQTIHFSREPVGSWIGVRSESVVQPGGSGFNSADLFDAAGRVGRSAAALVIERRLSALVNERRPSAGDGS